MKSPLLALALSTAAFAATSPAPKTAAPAAPAAAPVATPAAAPAAVPAATVAQPVKMDSVKIKDQYRFSYIIGNDMAQSLKQLDYTLDQDMLVRGMLDAMNKPAEQLALSEAERMQAMQDLMNAVREKKAKQDSLASVENKAKAQAFLAKNQKAKGVVTTKSGLQYSYIQKGKGASPKASDIVKAHYVGTLLDGSEFDSSIKRGEPISFPLSNVIPGWQEMLPLMKVGDKVKTWIPSALAYGEQGNAMIPPNSLLIFEIELLGIEAPKTNP